MGKSGAYCPFCGAFDSTVVHDTNGIEVKSYVMCATCGAKGPSVNFRDQDVNDEAVIDLWNTRVSITKKKLKS